MEEKPPNRLLVIGWVASAAGSVVAIAMGLAQWEAKQGRRGRPRRRLLRGADPLGPRADRARPSRHRD